MSTLTDKIGEEYKENWDRFEKNYKSVCDDNDKWYREYNECKEHEQYEQYENYGYKDGNCIFISAPTGSGKTYFILNTWLKYLASKKKKMLYLVNRSILKSDIEKKIYDMHSTDSRFIDVKLYQEIEAELKNDEYKQSRRDRRDDQNGQNEVGDKAYLYKDMRMKYVDYDCVVCDECHYFLADSNFNTDTSLSFRLIQDCFTHKIRIFMSATINEMKAYIKAYNYKREHSGKNDKYYFVDVESKEWEKEDPLNERFGYYSCKYFDDYEIEKNYDYLDVQIIYSYGKNQKLESVVETINIAESTDETQSMISEFIDKEGREEKWLIFVDNKKLGESLEKKFGKNNVVFISSTNRKDKEKSDTVKEIIVNEKIKKQILIATSVLDNGINLKDYQLRNVILMADTETEFIQMLGRKRADGEKVKLYIYRYDKKHFENRLESVKKRWEIAVEYENDLKMKEEKYGHEYDEDRAINLLHIKLMRKIADNKIAVEDVRSLFNVYGGVLYLNPLAYQNLKNLKEFYEMVLRKFDENGEDAFVKIQLGWLGIDEAAAEVIIEDSKLSKEERCLKKFNAWIGENCNTPMSKADYLDKLKEIQEQINFLAESTKDMEGFQKNVLNDIKKNERPITNNNLMYLKKFYKIPYEIESANGIYTFVECQSGTQEESK